MLKRTTRLIGSLLASTVVMSSGSAAFAWSALQYSAKEDIEKSGSAKPVLQSILDEHSEQAKMDPAGETPSGDAPGGNQNAVGELAPPGEQAAPPGEAPPASDAALTEFDKQVAKPVTRAPEAAAEAPRPARKPGRQPNEDCLDPHYFYKRALSFVRQNDLQSALNYVNKALELQPHFWQAAYEKAMIYQLAGYDAAAARRYLDLVRRYPERPEAHIALGSLYRKHKNYDLAEDEYKQVIEQNFNSFEAHFNYANLLMDQDKPDQALKEYKVCLKLQPRNALVHNNIGVIYEKRNFLEEAAEEYTKASHFDPANQKFADNLSQVRTRLGHKPGKGVSM